MLHIPTASALAAAVGALLITIGLTAALWTASARLSSYTAWEQEYTAWAQEYATTTAREERASARAATPKTTLATGEKAGHHLPLKSQREESLIKLRYQTAHRYRSAETARQPYIAPPKFAAVEPDKCKRWWELLDIKS